jgi:hypothetical protein
MLGETVEVVDELGEHTVDLERGSARINTEMVDGLNAERYEGDPHLAVSLRQMVEYVHGESDRVPALDVWRTLIESNEELAVAYREGKRVTFVRPDGEFDGDVQSAIQFAHEPQPIHVDDLPGVSWNE